MDITRLPYFYEGLEHFKQHPNINPNADGEYKHKKFRSSKTSCSLGYQGVYQDGRCSPQACPMHDSIKGTSSTTNTTNTHVFTSSPSSQFSYTDCQDLSQPIDLSCKKDKISFDDSMVPKKLSAPLIDLDRFVSKQTLEDDMFQCQNEGHNDWPVSLSEASWRQEVMSDSARGSPSGSSYQRAPDSSRGSPSFPSYLRTPVTLPTKPSGDSGGQPPQFPILKTMLEVEIENTLRQAEAGLTGACLNCVGQTNTGLTGEDLTNTRLTSTGLTVEGLPCTGLISAARGHRGVMDTLSLEQRFLECHRPKKRIDLSTGGGVAERDRLNARMYAILVQLRKVKRKVARRHLRCET